MSLSTNSRSLSIRALVAVGGLLLGGLLPVALAQSGPDPFTFVVRTNQATNVLVTSEAKTLTGFSDPLAVSVSGAGNPQYKVGSGTFTSAPGTIVAGQTLTLRHTSASSANTETISTVTVGSYSTSFKSVTGATDRTPDAFDFGVRNGTFPNTYVESDPQTLTGFNASVSIIPGNGAQYRIDGGAWTNASGSLLPGQVLQMRHLTSSGELAYTQTNLKVGGITGFFTTRNRSNTNQAPIADAGADQEVDENTVVTLDGSASADAEGALSYAWAQTGGPDVTLSNADTATPSFTAPDVTGDETLTFELTVTDDVGASASDDVQVTVVDTRTLSIADAQASEAAGSIEFTVTVSPAANRTVTVNYATADGTANASDYTGAQGTLTIPAGGTSALIIIPVTADTFDENDETFTLGLSDASGAAIGNGIATGTILDDDTSNLLRIGAARRNITPAQTHIDGVEEPRVFGAGTHVQKFNLGGFGINPLSNTPDDPAGLVQMGNESLTEPASNRLFTNSQDREEHTQVRALAIEQPSGATVVFVMIDAVGAGNIIQKNLKAAVIAQAATLGVTLAPENILFGQTHTHAGADLQGLWGGVPQSWIEDVLYPAAADAVREALATRQASHVRLRQGNTGQFNSYRRPRSTNPDADADGTLTLISATADDGTPVGSILQYNAHPTSVNVGGNRIPHADYILGAMEWIEDPAQFGGVSLYYNGPIADASGSSGRAGCTQAPQDQPYSGVRCRGQGIADYLLNSANVLADRELAPTLEARAVEAYLPVTNPGFLAFGLTGSFNRYYNFMDAATDMIPGIEPFIADLPQLTPVARTHVSRVTLGGAEGGLEIVTIPGEATNTFGQYIRGLAKTNVMLLGLTHNSFGYIIPEEEFSLVDQEGDDGLVAPFTGYEENVSLGPLTAPMLRTQAYNPLFDAAPEQNVPPTVSACLSDPESTTCATTVADNRLSALLNGIEACVEGGPRASGCPLQTSADFFEALFDGWAENCRSFGGPEELCGIFEGTGDVVSLDADARLVPMAAQMVTRGCDLLDPAHCLYPFPNDHFTVDATPGSPQAADQGGTGRRVNFNVAGMPRNSAGKPVDPTEWNRNDGFSPGALIVTYVPGLAVEDNGSVTGAVPIMDVARSRDADAPIFVIDADTGERHLVWAEIDLNANLLAHGAAPEVETGKEFERPLHDGRAALIIRPASNFLEGHRYIVALRNLKGEDGRTLKPNLGLQVCRGDVPSALREQDGSPVKTRCDHVAGLIDTLANAEDDNGFDAGDLYLAWDFTVASARNNVGRLAHMRDDAFGKLATVPGTDCSQHADGLPCGAPVFTIDKVSVAGDPGVEGGIARKIEGTFTVPSYVVPVEPTPADNSAGNAAMMQFCDGAPGMNEDCHDLIRNTAGGATLPPNRLFYNPSDATPTDPTQAPWGDGLPDSVGTMQTRFICQIPERALTEGPARAGIYGHGLLDGHVAITYDGVDDISREYNFMFCAADLFGFARGDMGNVASQLADVSNFPVIPDGSQQGLLNYMFLARLIAHPQGFAGDPAFQAASGNPLFDRREVFYDGNSQGGIIGGVVMAISKDVNRGVLGSLGMNYSTLLQRSKDFDPFSTPLYLAYTDPLDRMFLYSLIQMLWDRSENNGYAQHLTQKSAVEGGPVDAVLLNPMYGDQQVTMWSADVMARTMGIPVDYDMVGRAGKTHPDVVPGWPLSPLQYDVDAFADDSSALIMWADTRTAEPVPTGNVPHRAGRDPHDDSAKKAVGRCVKAHFLHRNGRLLDVNTDAFQPEQPGSTFTCPAQQDNSGAPGAGDVEPPAGGFDFVAVLEQWAAAAQEAMGQLAGGDPESAFGTLQGATGELVADLYSGISQAIGDAAGIGLEPPAPGVVDNPAPQPLMAGVAKAALQVPVGVPLGGYLRPPVAGEYTGGDPAGELTDNIPAMADGCDQEHPESCPPLGPIPDELRTVHSPYATYFPPSRGYYDSLVAKAVAMYDGHDYVVLVKMDFIGMLDEVVQAVKQEVKERKGIDLGDGLVMSATHTHDGPGALANHSTRYFWLAMDAYQPELFERLVPQVADLVIAALDNLQPARFGHGTGLEADGSTGHTTLNSFRRNVSNYDYNVAANHELRRRIGVLRVDKADGEPLALVMNYAAHGIAFGIENMYFSGDVLGAAEREVEQGFNSPVVAMLVQNTGGNVSPRADGGPVLQRIERFGKLLAPQVRAVYDGIGTFDGQPDLRAVSQRIVLNRDTIGYPDTDGKNGDGDYPYPWGAAQCEGAPVASPEQVPVRCLVAPPPDADDLADNGVAENGAFVPADTIMTAVKIGDAMLLAQPGEPLSEYGVRVLDAAQDLGLERNKTFIWGYSQDHIGYLMADNKADWSTGGTEGTTTFWGWKLGDRLLKANVALMESLRDETPAPAHEFAINYFYRDAYRKAPRPPVTPSVLAGAVVSQPSDIKRFETTHFVFEGGDPVLDLPSVRMLHADGTPVRRANGEILDSFFEMHLKYRLVSGRHLWTVEFEAPKDWDIGAYRFAVSGKASQGTEIAYELESVDFTVAAATNLQAQGLACGPGSCTVQLNYTPVPTNYRVVDARVPSGNAAPMRTGSVTFTNGTDTVVVPADGSGNFSAAIDGTVTVSAVDAWGNTKPAAGGPPPTDTDGDGVPDSADECPTEAGPASNNGCPEANEPPPFPVPLCEPFTEEYCLSDIPEIGEPLQQALLDAWEAVNGGGSEPPPAGEDADYGSGAIGLLAELVADLNGALTSIIDGDAAGAQAALEQAAAHAQENAEQVGESGSAGEAIGTDEEPQDVVARATTANRDVEAVVLTGAQLPDWSAPSAMGVAKPYPSGAGQYYDTADQACGELPDDEAPFPTGPFPNNLRAYCEAYLAQVLHDQGPRGDQVWTDPVRNAYNGTMLYPQGWTPGAPPVAGGVPVGEIAAFRWNATSQQFEEIPVQVDERKPYFLANANSGFSFYSGTDEELSYAWDTESWGMTRGQCDKAYDPAGWDTNPAQADRNTGISRALPDPVAGIDHDDEIVFMAADAGAPGPTAGFDPSWKAVQIVRLNDPLDPSAERVVYLVQKSGGSRATRRYVSYTRDDNADQWIDRSFFADSDPLKLGTSNTGYGPNLQGTVCKDGAQTASNDRFPRDGVTVTTDTYRWQATGRWMLRDIRVRQPDVSNPDPAYWESRPDLVDRWKGRAFQQSPDSTVSLVGFEDEQVNWEANSSLLGERCGPVRCMREVWGADSGTNVTKIETFYRDAVTYRYHVRVHPIPPDGLYTSWDYNRSAMMNPQNEGAEGRYFTVLRPQGVPIDGQNDDVGQVDSVGGFPAFFDAADPTFNLPLAFDNWEQISGKDDLGSLVYLFELKGPTSLLTPAVVPYYRDDACLDDGTGDDPVQRPYPGETTGDSRVRNGYAAAANKPYDELACAEKQGAHAQHGVHYFFTGDVDNATAPKPVNEIDGVQWQFMVPTGRPKNIAEPYANVVRAPLQPVITPGAGSGGGAASEFLPDYDTCMAMANEGGLAEHEAAAKFTCAILFGGSTAEGSDADGEIQGPTHYVTMSDGTLIATNIYIPWSCNAKNPDAKPCASILEMSGYDGGSDDGPTPSSDFEDILTEEFGINGVMPLQGGSRAANNKYYRSDDRYVSVVASVRGTGCSSGEFDLFSRKSALDGYQLIEWMADQSWSNGKVGLFGHSYSGITAAMIAATAPPSLRMATVSGQIGDLYRDIVYPGGVSNYGFPLLWTGGVRVIADVGGGQMAGIYADTQDRQCAQNVATHTRTVENDPLVNGLGDTDGPWYYERSVVNFLHNVNVPTQVVTAYQDEQTGPRGGTNVFDHLPQNLTRRLVMLNGNHGSQVGPAEVTAERRWWMDHFMLDANDPITSRRPRAWAPGNALPAPQVVAGQASSRVLLEVSRSKGNRSNGHIDSSGFPLAQTQWTDYFFQVAGQIDTAPPTVTDGEEGASSSYASGSKRQAYSYTANGYIGNDDADTPVSVTDANGADELVFTLPATTTDLVFAGPIMANLFLSTTGADTELMVQLIDRDPATGERLYLQRGVLKASHRAITAQKSQCAAQPAGGRISRDCALADNIYRPHRPHDSATSVVTPLQIVEYRLEIFPVGHVLRAGHELLVKVHAPSLDDNDWAYIPKTAPALNTLFHSAEHPSRLRLPLIALADVARLGAATGTCDDSAMRCVIEDSMPNPPATLAAQCYAYGYAYEPGDANTFTNAFCGFVATIADAFGEGAGQVPVGEAAGQAAAGASTVTGAAGGALGGLTGEEGVPQGRVLAGVGVVDMTPDVGYGAGQYSPENTAAAGAATGGDVDPYVGGKKQEPAYGVQSRLTGRAIVIEGSNGKRIALLKSDNYLAQDHLVRRIGQLLADKGSSIGYDQILYGVTHAHSSTYLSSPSAGVWVFQDAFDARFFEFQARKLADAILLAEANLQPARMGATTVHHRIYKGNVVRPHRADDGTPAGYPREFGDHGLVVMRFDTDEAQPKPLAVWINWGQHPEGLDGYSLHSPDYVGALERFVDRELGAPMVFSQGDVGSAENSGNTGQRIRDDGTVCAGAGATGGGCPAGQGVQRDWQHAGHAQGERGARFLADAIVKGWKVIGGEQPADAPVAGPKPNNYVPSVQVPMSSGFPVDYRSAWVPGPLSHPYPGVSACRTETTAEGNPGVPNAADCAHVQDPNSESQMFWQTLKAHGIPVPENYDLPAFGTVEENLRLRLQAFRVGDVVLGSSASEAQVDLILNFESRANDVEGDIYDGFDWACLLPEFKDDPKYLAACALQEEYFDPAEFHWDLAPHGGATSRDPAAIARTRAQVHNDASGWDSVEYVPYANAEPDDITQIKGNFTKEELPAAQGYKLAVGIGHAGDYNGYTVSYREYMAYDDYRKALTSYGAHTADYMVTRMVRMAGAMKGAPELKPEPHDAFAQADEARQVAASTALGRSTAAAYESFLAALPPDVGPAEPIAGQQPANIGWFEAATFTWRGGSTAADNPQVVVERCDGGTGPACDGGTWRLFAGGQGEVQTRVQPPQGAAGLASTYGGQQEWLWTANFEAFEGFPARLGSTPAGVYRFVVEGCINDFSAPDASLQARITSFLSGMLPDAVASQVLAPAACRSGATPYGFESDGFEVVVGADRVESVATDGNGNLTIGVAARSIPKTYESGFRFINDGDDFGSFCKECSFRPWAYSTAAPVSVALVVDGVTYPVVGSGTSWTASVGAEGGRVAAITATYADGRVSRPVTLTLTGVPQTIGGGSEPPPPEEPPSEAPQLCMPDQVPEIGGQCAADNGGEAVQEAVNTVYDTITGLPIPSP